VNKNSDNDGKLTRYLYLLILGATLCIIFVGIAILVLYLEPDKIRAAFEEGKAISPQQKTKKHNQAWIAPELTSIPNDARGAEILFGRELIVHTSEFLGPKGKLKQISNGMNCQNCHLDGGTRLYGNNYSAVASTYPKFRARSGTIETIEKRVNDCIERSLNGKALPDSSHEMKAMVAYIKWIGAAVTKDETPVGAGLREVVFIDSPADPAKGRALYSVRCTVCHGRNGEGLMNPQGTAWVYPPLWGEQSYNDGAGLYRLSRFAGFIKTNMPFGATPDQPILTDAECWHLAAYVNSLPRPRKTVPEDWPDITKKPIDHPFGPYHDGFSEQQHKFGPFKVIEDKRKELNTTR
jgi:thiosulfate dehydrogenase